VNDWIECDEIQKLSRQVIIEPDETGGYVVSCPSLPGCHSQGETIDEVLANIREAIELYIEVLEEDGLQARKQQ
jgi:predicted RNase H-like HicB family nuclease